MTERANQKDFDSNSSSVSTSEVLNIIEKLKMSRVRNSTKKLYHQVWNSFNEFFIRLDSKPDSWEDRLVLYVGYLADRNRKSQTIKSYISAIKNILADDGIVLNTDKFLLTSLIRACRYKNDAVRTRLPIHKGLLNIILKYTDKHFNNLGQIYLKKLYKALFATSYYGLFRVGELT